MNDIRTRRVEDIFQTTLEDMLQRSASSSYHPIVTYRTNAAHRFFAVARRPAEGAGNAVALQVPQVPGTVRAPLRTSPQGRSPAAPAAPTGASFADDCLARHLRTACRVIARQTPILLRGETGSGKEVFARAVHDGSPMSAGAFVAINCASLPESLIESELFGYRAGAFTGAQRTGRRGKILQADGGTLFLDEIGDMPLDLQARLLRVLEERQVTPLGTEEAHAVDFQLLSASHRDLLAMVEEGLFREDLYYRLAGIELDLPPLRARTDKRELIRSLLAAEGGEAARLSPEAEGLLMAYEWPGNVRQLRHVLRSAAALTEDGQSITAEHLPAVVLGGRLVNAPVAQALLDSSLEFFDSDEFDADSEASAGLNPIQANERQVLLRMLEQHRWNVSNVAKALDVSRNTLYRKLHKLRIQITQRCGQ